MAVPASMPSAAASRPLSARKNGSSVATSTTEDESAEARRRCSGRGRRSRPRLDVLGRQHHDVHRHRRAVDGVADGVLVQRQVRGRVDVDGVGAQLGDQAPGRQQRRGARGTRQQQGREQREQEQQGSAHASGPTSWDRTSPGAVRRLVGQRRLLAGAPLTAAEAAARRRARRPRPGPRRRRPAGSLRARRARRPPGCRPPPRRRSRAASPSARRRRSRWRLLRSSTIRSSSALASTPDAPPSPACSSPPSLTTTTTARGSSSSSTSRSSSAVDAAVGGVDERLRQHDGVHRDGQLGEAVRDAVRVRPHLRPVVDEHARAAELLGQRADVDGRGRPGEQGEGEAAAGQRHEQALHRCVLTPRRGSHARSRRRAARRWPRAAGRRCG